MHLIKSGIQALNSLLIRLLRLILALTDYLLHLLVCLTQLVHNYELAQLHLAVALLRFAARVPHVVARTLKALLRLGFRLSARLGRCGRYGDQDHQWVVAVWLGC